MIADPDVTYSIDIDANGFETVLADMEASAERFGGVLSRALRSAVVDGRDLESVLRGVALRLTDIALDIGTKPLETMLTNTLSGITAGLAGRIIPFAAGGVVAAPTYFPLGGDTGLMGEAGAEAILPLARGSDGRLGVAASGGSTGPQIVLNVVAQDVDSFRKSEAQVTAMLARAVGRGTRGL